MWYVDRGISYGISLTGIEDEWVFCGGFRLGVGNNPWYLRFNIHLLYVAPLTAEG